MTHDQVIAYYTRDDVMQLLWRLCQTRRLTFHYRSDQDFRRQGAKADTAGFHCVPDPDALRKQVRDCLKGGNTTPGMFYPFWNMSSRANYPGKPNVSAGWDLRFEMDADIQRSFDAVIPAWRVLEYFGIPVIAKYSGFRSLHLVLPAEAFDGEMRASSDHQEWMAAFEAVGHFLCRFAPSLTRTDVSIAKDFVLTAPYTLHRYAGRVSLPLTLDEALGFAPDSADPAKLKPFDADCLPASSDGQAMHRLLEAATVAKGDAASLAPLAAAMFPANPWQSFALRMAGPMTDSEPVMAVLMAGLPGISLADNAAPHDEALTTRMVRAIQSMDRPDTKDMKFHRLITPLGFTPHTQSPRIRAVISGAMAPWVRGGLPRAMDHLWNLCSDATLAAPVGAAVRMFPLLPEAPHDKRLILTQCWSQQYRNRLTPGSLFVGLALGELAGSDAQTREELLAHGRPELRPLAAQMLEHSGAWRVEERPDLAMLVIALLWGPEVPEQAESDAPSGFASLIVAGLVGGNAKKARIAWSSVKGSLPDVEL